jgi:hypothetical protein
MLATQNVPGDNELELIVKDGDYGWPLTGYKYQPGIVDPIAGGIHPIGPTGITFYTSDQVPTGRTIGSTATLTRANYAASAWLPRAATE